MTLKFRTKALLVVGGLLAVAAPAAALQYENPYGTLDPGYYTIRIDPAHHPHKPAAGDCLIQGNNGTGGPVRHMWNEPNANRAFCNWGNFKAFFDNGQALFTLKPVDYFDSAGARAYVIVNKRSGQCLQWDARNNVVKFSSTGCNPDIRDENNDPAIWFIAGKGNHTFSPIKPLTRSMGCLIFGNNGHDVVPQVYRWSENRLDTQWCNIGSEDALVATGQAVFWLTKVSD